MDDLRPRGPWRFVLRALAIAGALAFLALVMAQAMAFYAPPPEAPKTHSYAHPDMLAPPTKDAPVVPPPPLVKPALPRGELDLFPATKAGTLSPPRWLVPSAPARQQP